MYIGDGTYAGCPFCGHSELITFSADGEVIPEACPCCRIPLELHDVLKMLAVCARLGLGI